MAIDPIHLDLVEKRLSVYFHMATGLIPASLLMFLVISVMQKTFRAPVSGRNPKLLQSLEREVIEA